MAVSSVERVARRFCHSLPQGVRPARRMIRFSCVPRFCVESRYFVMTRMVFGSACSQTASRCGFNSGKIGSCRLSFPSWWAVFGLHTVRRFLSQSTSAQVSARCSLGHLRPPNRLRANSRRRRWVHRTLTINLSLGRHFRDGQGSYREVETYLTTLPV